jgi:hypothetical protein
MTDNSQNLGSARPAVSRKVAWSIVLIMTVLFLLALAGVIWGFVRQAGIYMAARESGTVPAAAPASVLTLPPGARILSAETEAGKLVVQVASPDGTQVDVIDLATGKLSFQVRTQAQK